MTASIFEFGVDNFYQRVKILKPIASSVLAAFLSVNPSRMVTEHIRPNYHFGYCTNPAPTSDPVLNDSTGYVCSFPWMGGLGESLYEMIRVDGRHSIRLCHTNIT